MAGDFFFFFLLKTAISVRANPNPLRLAAPSDIIVSANGGPRDRRPLPPVAELVMTELRPSFARGFYGRHRAWSAAVWYNSRALPVQRSARRVLSACLF
jgi:hypothetical protein